MNEQRPNPEATPDQPALPGAAPEPRWAPPPQEIDALEAEAARLWRPADDPLEGLRAKCEQVQVFLSQILHWPDSKTNWAWVGGDIRQLWVPATDWCRHHPEDDKDLPDVPVETPNAAAGLNQVKTLLRWLAAVRPRPTGPGEVPRHADPNAAGLAGMLPEFAAAPDLARLLQQPLKRVDACLRRLRKQLPDCYVEVEEKKDRRRNEPRYMYRTADVWPALQEQLPRRPN
jgi:hypothetical protein